MDSTSQDADYGDSSQRATIRMPIRLPASDHELTVIIPAFNEERRLPGTLQALATFLDQSDIDYRVIVADDGSSDRTPELAEIHGWRFSTVRLPQNTGKGCAVRTAMLTATGQVVAFTDADLPFQLDSLIAAFSLIRARQCEIVFGNRHANPAGHSAKRQLMRRVATRTYHGLVQCLVATDVTDTQCGLKAFSRRAAIEIFSRAEVDGFAFDTEVVLLARHLKLSHRSIAVSLVNESASTVSLMRHALPMLWDVVRLRARVGRLSPAPQLPIGWGQLATDGAKAA